MHRQKLGSWALVISVAYFVLSQEIVFLLWLLPNEELWISRGYVVCAAATMEPDGPQAGIFHLDFSLQWMIFPGMRDNPWAKVCNSNCSCVCPQQEWVKRAEVLPKQENLGVLYTVGNKTSQYQAITKMVLNKKNQITLFATNVSNLQFRQWSCIYLPKSNFFLKQHIALLTVIICLASFFYLFVFDFPLFFSLQ